MTDQPSRVPDGHTLSPRNEIGPGFVRRALRLVAWAAAVPVALIAASAGVVLVGNVDTSWNRWAEVVVGIVSLVTSGAILFVLLRSFSRTSAQAETVSELPDGEEGTRVRLHVPWSAYTGPMRGDGPSGKWLDIGERYLLIHDGLQHRALVSREHVTASVTSTFWSRRLRLDFDLPVAAVVGGKPVLVRSLLVSAPERDFDEALLLDAFPGGVRAESRTRYYVKEALIGLLMIAGATAVMVLLSRS